jgi:hypothetical protein
MKRTLLAGTFTLLAGAAALLLAASIVFSCRTGADPHHSGSASTLDAPPTETTESAPTSQADTNAARLSVAQSRSAQPAQ